MTQLHQSAKVIARSRPPAGGEELISILLTYPRFIHPQLLRHRMFAHSAQSSRAVSFEKTLEWLEANGPVIPVFCLEKRGMQAGPVFDDKERKAAEKLWLSTFKKVLASASQLSAIHDIHHTIPNRILEPFMPIAHLMTGTEKAWNRFLFLRLHQDADIHALELAWEIKDKIDASHCQTSLIHIPFKAEISDSFDLTMPNWYAYPDSSESFFGTLTFDFLAGSFARCARISYLNYDKQKSLQEERKFALRLWTYEHFSPFEHVAVSSALVENSSGLLGEDWVAFRHLDNMQYVEPFLNYLTQ